LQLEAGVVPRLEQDESQATYEPPREAKPADA
jgi:hypothetical protein